MRHARKDVAAIAAVILLCGFAVVQTTFAQSEYETRQQELERPSNQEQMDLGDERQREVEGREGEDEQLEQPSSRQNQMDLGDERQRELEQ